MQFQIFSFPPDPVEYIAPRWDELQSVAFAVSKQLRAQNKQFDRLITLAKGGWPMSRSLVDYLHIPEVASVGIKFYQGTNERYAEPVVYQDLPVAVKGERVLLFDDVADSGESLLFAREYLLKRGVAEVTTATLFYKKKSKVIPDVFGAETAAWIIFPFEMVEIITELRSKWLASGVTDSEVLSRFTAMGFAKEQVQYYLSANQ